MKKRAERVFSRIFWFVWICWFVFIPRHWRRPGGSVGRPPQLSAAGQRFWGAYVKASAVSSACFFNVYQLFWNVLKTCHAMGPPAPRIKRKGPKRQGPKGKPLSHVNRFRSKSLDTNPWGLYRLLRIYWSYFQQLAPPLNLYMFSPPSSYNTKRPGKHCKNTSN